jgi:hypothetical protein
MEFKGTKGIHKPIKIHGICIGVGIDSGNGTQRMIANSILDHINSEEDYNLEKEEIEANMLLYSKALELLLMVDKLCEELEWHQVSVKIAKQGRKLIKEATEL